MLRDDVIARLGATIPALAQRIEGAAQFAALTATDALPNETPFAFVMQAGIDAQAPRDATGVHHQALHETISVILVVEYAGDASGGQALPDADILGEQIIASLAGWKAASAADVMELKRSRLIDIRKGTVFTQLDFMASRHLRIPT